MSAGPLTLEDLERLERSGDNVRQHSLDPSSDCAVAADAIDELLAALRSVMADLAEFKAENIRIETDRATLELRALAAEHQLRSVMAERDRAESHAKRAETLAHDLQAQVLALRSLFVNFRWDGPAWIKPEEHRAMEEANRLAGGKPLDA